MGRKSTTRPTRVLAILSLACVVLLLPAGSRAAEGEEAAGVTLYQLAPSFHPSGVTIAPDGTVWFAGGELARNRTVIGHLGPGAEVTEFDLPESGGSLDVASPVSGPDGNVWFVRSLAGRIGRLAPTGEVTEFPLPPGSGPNALAVGPDGNLWFTERGAGRIGRITPAGEISHFPLGPRSRPTGITRGPDGSVWFTLERADKIGHIATSGEIELFRLARTTQPRAIVAGPDGNLWFTEGGWRKRGRKGRNKIGRITPGGVVTQFRVRAPFGTGSIAAGSTGNISFTTGTKVGDSLIGSITPAGVVTRYACLSVSCRLPAYGLAQDAEGAVWFAAGVPPCGLCGGGSVINMHLTWQGQIGRLAP